MQNPAATRTAAVKEWLKLDFFIRPFDPADAHAVRGLQEKWFYEDISYGERPDDVDALRAAAPGPFFVAQSGGEVVGFVRGRVESDNARGVFPRSARVLVVEQLYVRADCRRGHIGGALLSKMEDWAAGAGVIHVYLQSDTKDEAAVRRFYARGGYGVWTTLFYKRMDWDVRTFALGELDAYRYVVIFARYGNGWLFPRHKERATFEPAGGHIEPGETPMEAARRELYEETGAVDFEIRAVLDYSVHQPESFASGQVFLADVRGLGPIPESEMAEVRVFETLPEMLTYPRITPILYRRIQGIVNDGNHGEELWDVYDGERKRLGYMKRRDEGTEAGEYRLVVHVWIMDAGGRFLITKRAPNKGYANMWEAPGGLAQAGDDGLTAAVREAREETGIVLPRERGCCLFTVKDADSDLDKGSFSEVWLFRVDFDLDAVVLQEGETTDAARATLGEIREMMREGRFLHTPYLDRLEACVRG